MALTYGDYLKLDELLALQCPRSTPMVPDELLFITVHQVFELWLKLLLFELSHARDEMLAGKSYAPRVRLERCRSIERSLLEQFDVLDSMETAEFVRFRDALDTASGGQSAQFLEIEFLSGLKDSCYAKRCDWLTACEHESLQRRLSEPCLWEAFLAVERQIGAKSGTGGSIGATYLQSGLSLRFYPELWELRSRL